MSRLFKPLLAVLALCVLSLSGCALGNATNWAVPKRDLAGQMAMLAEHTDIRIPSGTDQPVATVIMFHGCGGLRQVQEDYAATALEAGYGVMIIGSNAARGIGRFGAMSQVCTALRLWGQERAADVFAAIAIADADPRLDAQRLALIGWSHGGWTVLDALGFHADNRTPPALLDPAPDLADHVRVAITVYPYCGFPVRTDGRGFDPQIPVRAILAERDLIAPTGDCERLLDRARATGANIDYAVWANVTHAFDEPNQPPDPRMEYNAEAAERARQHMRTILVEELGSPTGPAR